MTQSLFTKNRLFDNCFILIEVEFMYASDKRQTGFWLGITDKGNVGNMKVASDGNKNFNNQLFAQGFPVQRSVPQAALKTNAHGTVIYSREITKLAYPLCHIPMAKLP